MVPGEQQAEGNTHYHYGRAPLTLDAQDIHWVGPRTVTGASWNALKAEHKQNLEQAEVHEAALELHMTEVVRMTEDTMHRCSSRSLVFDTAGKDYGIVVVTMSWDKGCATVGLLNKGYAIVVVEGLAGKDWAAMALCTFVMVMLTLNALNHRTNRT